MPDIISTQQAIRRIVNDALADCRVTPDLPPDRKPTRVRKGSEDSRLDDSRDRDDTSGWSLFIDYVDSRDNESSRRITLIRCESRLGAVPAMAAYCHEAEDYRLFRIDRIRSMALCGTGEVVDPVTHLALLRDTGLPFINRGMLTVATILLFMARCDGHHHPDEWAAIERGLERYALHFDGSDADISATMEKARSLAPDATDFANALIALTKTPAESRKPVAAMLISLCGAMIDADGRHTPEEIQWGAAVGKALNLLID